MTKKTKDQQKNDRLYKTYGITLDHWNYILEEQKGVCAVCKTLPGKGILCVDHVHIPKFKQKTPKEKRQYVRGLVCFMCNVGFKAFEKTSDGKRNRQALNGTLEYFSKYPLKGEIC